MGRAWRWVLLTPPVVLLAHYLAVLPHEFAHRFMAWALRGAFPAIWATLAVSILVGLSEVGSAYVVGWPISMTADLPAMGLPACATPDQTGCILSWQSFGEPADPSLILDLFDQTNGYTGAPRKDTAMLCTNPLTGTPGIAAPAVANLGTLYPSADLKTAEIVAGRVPAKCEGRGILTIGEGPSVGPYVLPGNNYHVYDYSLFWANVRADADRRLKAFR